MGETPELAPEPAPTAPCAVHEGAQATGTCARCGNFVCPLCLDVVADHDDWCEACREREGGDKMPWERDEGSLIARWWETTRAVLLHPASTIARVRPGSLKKALAYNALTGLLMGAVGAVLITLVVLGAAALGDIDELVREMTDAGVPPEAVLAAIVVMVVLTPLLNVVYTVLVAGLRGAVFQLAGLAMGGGGAGGDPYWIACYLGAAHVTWLPLQLVQQIPIIGLPIAMLCHLAVEIWYALAFTEAAEQYQGLTQGRAVFAGWAGFVALTLTFLCCCFSGVFAALAGV